MSCLPVLTLKTRDTAVGDTSVGDVSVYAGDLASSGKATSTFPNSFVARGGLSTSTLSLGPADTVLNLGPETLATLIAADDPFPALLEYYTTVHGKSKREANTTPIISNTVYPATEMEGLVLVEGL